jgi:hypothetical protein
MNNELEKNIKKIRFTNKKIINSIINILTNIINNPEDEKYKKIKLTNPKMKTILEIEQTQYLFKYSGFEIVKKKLIKKKENEYMIYKKNDLMELQLTKTKFIKIANSHYIKLVINGLLKSSEHGIVSVIKEYHNTLYHFRNIYIPKMKLCILKNVLNFIIENYHDYKEINEKMKLILSDNNYLYSKGTLIFTIILLE